MLDDALDRERAGHEMSGGCAIAHLQRLADAAGGYDLPVEQHGSHRLCAKANTLSLP